MKVAHPAPPLTPVQTCSFIIIIYNCIIKHNIYKQPSPWLSTFLYGSRCCTCARDTMNNGGNFLEFYHVVVSTNVQIYWQIRHFVQHLDQSWTIIEWCSLSFREWSSARVDWGGCQIELWKFEGNTDYFYTCVCKYRRIPSLHKSHYLTFYIHHLVVIQHILTAGIHFIK